MPGQIKTLYNKMVDSWSDMWPCFCLGEEEVAAWLRAGGERVPLADDLHCIFLSGLLVCAASAYGEATLSQNTVPQVHLITHVER